VSHPVTAERAIRRAIVRLNKKLVDDDAAPLPFALASPSFARRRASTGGFAGRDERKMRIGRFGPPSTLCRWARNDSLFGTEL